MKCQTCHTKDALIHVIDVVGPGTAAAGYECAERHVCDDCAARMDLPTVPTKQLNEIWKLLESAKRRNEGAGVSCPHCGMTLAEFRAKGRLGCPHDYEVFREHLDPLLERIHNASAHVGRIPGGEIERPVEPTGPVAVPSQTQLPFDAPVGAIAAAGLGAEIEPPTESGATGSTGTGSTGATDVPVEVRRRQLARQLRAAIVKEDYELAAKLRDDLRSLEAGGEKGSEPASSEPDAEA